MTQAATKQADILVLVQEIWPIGDSTHGDPVERLQFGPLDIMNLFNSRKNKNTGNRKCRSEISTLEGSRQKSMNMECVKQGEVL